MLGGGGGRRWSASGFRADSLGQRAVHQIGNLGFAIFVLGVVVFTIIVATHQPEDPLLRPSSRHLTSFLSSTSNATFLSIQDSAASTGEDFILSVPAAVDSEESFTAGAAQSDDVSSDESYPTNSSAASFVADLAPCSGAVGCADAEVLHAMMRAVIDRSPDLRINRFGKAVAVPDADAAGGGDTAVCDLAWRFRPKNAKRVSFYKDYRRFTVGRSSTDCTLSVLSIGDYHSGVMARKPKKPKRAGSKEAAGGGAAPLTVPEVGEAVNDALPVVESESSFSRGRYLIYSGGGDRCKSMNHYLWSFLCSLGEAQYLNRTLVMDLSLCLSSMYTRSKQDEEGKDFRFYFDFEHLRDSASVLDQSQFWDDWNRWQKQDGLTLRLVEDPGVMPMELAGVSDALVMRKFGSVEPDNYWYRVCEGAATEAAVHRPWHLLWKSPRLMDVVSGIASKMSWDFDAVHVVRGEKARNTELWPNLAYDTSPEALSAKLAGMVGAGRRLYVATNEPDASLFDPLRGRYETRLLEDFRELWEEGSEWYSSTAKLNNGVPVEFDGYMRSQVDTEVFMRGKKQIETFNDLTGDCRDGVNTCAPAVAAV